MVDGLLSKRKIEFECRIWAQTWYDTVHLQHFFTIFSVEFLVELDVTSTGLFCKYARFLFPVLLCWGEFCCVVLHCLALCPDLLCCVCYVALWSIMLYLRSVAFCCACILLRSIVLCLLCCIALTNSTNLTNLTHWQTKSPHLDTT